MKSVEPMPLRNVLKRSRACLVSSGVRFPARFRAVDLALLYVFACSFMLVLVEHPVKQNRPMHRLNPTHPIQGMSFVIFVLLLFTGLLIMWCGTKYVTVWMLY